MLRKHKNALFELIGRESFATDIFTLRENAYEAMIMLNETPHRFILANHPHSFDKFIVRHTRFEPGYPDTKWYGPKGSVESVYESAITSVLSLDQVPLPAAYSLGDYRHVYDIGLFGEIDFACQRFGTWLAYDVVKHIEAHIIPDLWDSLSPFGNASSWSPQDEYEPFTTEQKTYVRQSVQNFRVLLIQNYSPNSDQLKAINEKLDYLTAAIDRLNRFDWFGLAINTAMSITTALSLDTTRGQQLLVLLKQAFGSVMRYLGSGG